MPGMTIADRKATEAFLADNVSEVRIALAACDVRVSAEGGLPDGFESMDFTANLDALLKVRNEAHAALKSGRLPF